MIEDDPVLGAFIDNYPSDRTRLLLFGGAIMGVIWFVVTIALWRVDDDTASAVTVGIIALATLGVGWFLTHFWNREVIVYKRGFSYREGSFIAFIRFDDIASIRQKAEQMSYFGGIVRRTVYRVTITTTQDEIIRLNNLYRKMQDLSVRLEVAVTQVIRPRIEAKLQAGEQVTFTSSLSMSATGLHHAEQVLPWESYQGYSVKGGMLQIMAQDNSIWYSTPLEDVDNLRLLVDLLREHNTQTDEVSV